MQATASLQGRVVLVTASESGIGATLADGLARLGAAVALLSEGDIQAPADHLRASIPTRFTSRADVEKAFAAAVAQLGPADVIVHTALPPLSLQSATLDTLDEARWEATCDAAMKAALYCLQAAFTHLSERGGSVVLAGPTVSFSGAPGLVPLVTAIEGQRALAKSAARQWGSRGITVNWIALDSPLFAPSLAQAALPPPPEPAPSALGRSLDAAADIAPVIAFLASAAGRSVTGATLVQDGGVWMSP